MTHDYCREYLKEVMKDVRKYVPNMERKKTWAYKYSYGNMVEFHGPHNFYWHGKGCCKYYAKAQGWQSYLRSIGVE